MIRRQRQRGGDASTNVQAGRDLTLHQGLTVDEVREIALGVFHQNFLELRGVAEEIALGRAEKITNEFLRALEERAPLALASASDPDMQRAIFDAQREYACSGDEDLETVLVDLLVDRANEPVRETRTIVLNEAITAAPKLTGQQRRAVAVCFLVKYTRWSGLATLENFFDVYLRGNLLPLADDLPTKPAAYQHIEYVGAGAVGLGHISLLDGIRRNGGRGYFTRGVARDELPDPLQPLADNGSIFMPCIRNAANLQLRAAGEEDLSTLLENLGDPDLEPHVRQVYGTGVFSNDEMHDDIVANVPEFQDLMDAWDKSSLSQLTLTSVGIAIGHGYWRRTTGGTAELSVWISD